MKKGILETLAALAFSTCAVAVASHHVSSADDIARITPGLRPGDEIILADGAWKDQAIAFRAKGSAAKPVTFRAQTPGKVIFSGNSSVVIEGEHLVVSGLFLDHCDAAEDGIRISASNCRLTESAVVGGRHKFFVHFFGRSNRMDRCYLAGKTNDHPTLQVEVEGRPNFHRLDHNHFGHRPPLGRNGGETIRVGYSHQSMTNSGTLVERNFFERCDGELEIISNKSCENTYRGNTFLDCAGMFTLRHGNRCRVEGNFIIGNHKRGSGGIRVIGEGHAIVRNHIEGVMQGGFWITSGISNSELRGYFQARNCVIAWNTFADSRGPALELDAGIGTSRRTLRPENIAVASNMFLLGTNGVLFKGRENETFKWRGNQVAGGSAVPRDGLEVVDADAMRQNITRSKEISGDAPSRPLTANDVGPSWLEPDRRK